MVNAIQPRILLLNGILLSLSFTGLTACGSTLPSSDLPATQTALTVSGSSMDQRDPSQVEIRYIRPSATSSQIPDRVPTLDGQVYAPGDHLVIAPSPEQARNTLLVFFPGTGGQPREYSLFASHAAVQGFHVINLAYENADSINFRVCQKQANPNCHKQARLEVLTGQDTSPLLTTDQRPASAAFARLAYLLRYLEQAYPQEGWDHYMDPAGRQLQWSKMMMAGHSQGGGMAAFTGTLVQLQRVILFNATEPALWTSEDTQTPSDRFYGIVHEQETNYTPITRSWSNLGLPGELVNLEETAPDYQGSHRLSTNNLDCLNTGGSRPGNPLFHNCVIADEYIPLDDSGAPQYTAVWDYLLGSPN